MAKRFTDTEIWNDDWWIELPDAYKFFWFFLKDHCDIIGVIRPQVNMFQRLTDLIVTKEKALELFNDDKQRIIILDDGWWLIKDYVGFQSGKLLSNKSSIHKNIRNKLIARKISPSMIGVELAKE